VATRKGAWFFHGDAGRKAWKADGPHFLGHTISHLQLDPRDGRTLLAAAKTGHLGPTIFRSTNLGRTWKEAQQPPAFAAPTGGLPARSVDHTFWLTPGHASERGTWYAGTSPQGLFRSRTAASAGRRCPPSTTTRSFASGWARCRTARPTARSCIRSSSTRATRRTCTSPCPAAVCTSRATPAAAGRR
jgi:hypothetical protein